MKRLMFGMWLLPLVLLSTGCLAPFPPPHAPAIDLEVSLGFFHEHLSPWGDWIHLEPWGLVWRPAGVGLSWRPYSEGRWIYTAHGWTWWSDRPWGWAVFHYGRWAFDTRHGWVWIPGTEWGPAWVAWRQGPGWIGWAPLPPEARWDLHLGLVWGPSPLELHWWMFVPDRHFLHRRLGSRIVERERTSRLLTDTRDVTRYEVSERGVVERSIERQAVERATGAAVRIRQIEDVDQPSARPRGTLDRDRAQLYRPEVPADGRKARQTRPPKPPASPLEPL